MERIMSVEEKIRRAEEIYNRRRQSEHINTNARVRVDNSRAGTNLKINQKLKKMIIQIIICLIIYLVFYYIINNNYIFSEDFRKKCQEILSYDISFSEMYKQMTDTLKTIEQKYQESVNSTNVEENTNTQQNSEDTQNEDAQNIEAGQDEGTSNTQELVEDNNNVNIESKDIGETQEIETNENIGGAVEQISNVAEKENLSEEEQMAKDAEYIKSKISFINPLERGVVTSNFGWRNPTVSTVSKYHTGIDIGIGEGTPIVSATDGKVILASSQGAYGNHLKIQIEDVQIIYAHCLSLEVKEGDSITQGQIIAKVGSTGNSTGPHLHFEIRIEDRYVNPKLIIDF